MHGTVQNTEQGSANFFGEGQMTTSLGFVGPRVSTLTTQLSRSSAKAARENKEMNEYGSVPIQIYLQKYDRSNLACRP